MASNVSMFYTKKELALKESAERKKGKRVFYLESDGWNDYGYETLFELYWTDEDNKFHEIGPVKIAHKSEKITRDLLENSFSRLEENFCSLSIDDKYYINILSITTKETGVFLGIFFLFTPIFSCTLPELKDHKSVVCSIS